MDIIWLGHSCFRLRGKEAVVVTDPYDQSLGYPALKVNAQIVTVSHTDPHHSHVAAVGGDPRVVDGPGEYEISATFLTGVATLRQDAQGNKLGRNTAYLIELDDLTVCHLGDLGHLLTSSQIEALESPDVLLVPIGGHCTLNASHASEVVSQLEPKLVIPMHYQSGKVRLELDSVERFLKEMGAAEVTALPRLSVSRSSLPEATEVALLSPPG